MNGLVTEKRVSKSDGKGNVVVSVRVRPDNNATQSNPDGEWMVDGRKSLIAYKGKEGGDYVYGMSNENQGSAPHHRDRISCSLSS